MEDISKEKVVSRNAADFFHSIFDNTKPSKKSQIRFEIHLMKLLKEVFKSDFKHVSYEYLSTIFELSHFEDEEKYPNPIFAAIAATLYLISVFHEISLMVCRRSGIIFESIPPYMQMFTQNAAESITNFITTRCSNSIKRELYNIIRDSMTDSIIKSCIGSNVREIINIGIILELLPSSKDRRYNLQAFSYIHPNKRKK